MHHRLLGPQQVAGDELGVAAEAVAAVGGQDGVAALAVARRQPVPGDAGLAVMQPVQVVVEEQQRQRPRGVDDHRAVLRVLLGAVLGERAQQRQRDPRIDEQREVLEHRDRAHTHHPRQHQGTRQRVQPPCPQRARLAAPQAHELAAPQAGDGDRRAERQAPEQRVAQAHERAAHRAALAPLLRGQVVRLGIVERVGQALVAVVRQVRVAVDAVGQPQPQVREHQRLVEARVARRMAVHGLVLQRAVPGDDVGGQRQHQPPGQGVVEPGQGGEAAVDQAGDRQRGPLEACAPRAGRRRRGRGGRGAGGRGTVERHRC
ncbi:MAG: hypothetical protein U5K43_06210 [Halofilum sp. (in: g-proteobacteria)]|nr:hypothetical protein [Halofilum sp. (in: g-proteobacteria)]